MDKDAQKAAKLTLSSIENTKVRNLEKAEEDYLKAEDLINKYRQKDQFEEFINLYNAYLYENNK